MEKFTKTIMSVVKAVACLALFGAVVCVALQVFTRYVLNNALFWTEQMTRFFFIWLVGLGIPLSFYEGGSFKFDLFYKKLYTVFGNVVGTITDIIVWASILIFSSYYFYWSLQLTLKMGSKVTAGVEMPMYFLYGIQPICAALLILVTANDIVVHIKKRKQLN